MIRWFLKWAFETAGWKIEGGLPADEKKFIIIIAPHTSLWDFPVGICVRAIVRAKVSYLAKKELFKFPLSVFLRWLGGHPVDRGKSGKLVDAVVDIYNSRESFAIALTPEGTRKQVSKFKTGFYYIARKAKIPIVMIGFDYSKKVVKFHEPVFVSDNQQQDMEMIMGFFKDFQGRHPELGIS